MFEVGKYYYLSILRLGDEGGRVVECGSCKILAVDLPLIKIWTVAEGETILNTSSHVFVSARPSDEGGG